MKLIPSLVAVSLVIPALAQAKDEVVTTARRNVERLVDVPVSITAISGDEIEAAQLFDLADVAAMTPGFSFQNYFGQDLSIATIRGVSQVDIFGDPNAPIFVDGVFVPNNSGVNFSFIDVERIEVLRGPQPAYFGYQSFSGAVNFVTAKPPEELEVKAEITVGSDDKQRVSASIGGPLAGDMLSGRVSFLYDDFAGTYDNYALDQDIGGAKYKTATGTLYFSPAETFDMQWNLYYSDDTVDPPAMNQVPANCEPELDDPTDPSSANPDRLLNYCGKLPKVGKNDLATIPYETGQDREIFRTNLNINWDVGFGTLTSLTGYTKTEEDIWASASRGDTGTVFAYQTDVDGFIPGSFVLDTFSAPLLQPSAGESELTDISQELRWSSPQDRRIRGTIGAYYRQTNSDIPILDPASGGLWASTDSIPDDMATFDFGFPGSPVFNEFCPCIPFGPPGSPGVSAGFGGFIFDGWFADMMPGLAYTDEAETQLWATFAAVQFDILDNLTLDLEGRYTDAEEEYQDNDPNIADPNDRVTKYSDDFFNWRVSLQFSPTADSTIYGSLATGSKQGGLENFTVETVLPDPDCPGPDCVDGETFNQEYGQEENLTYELGYKAIFMDGRLSTDVAVYYIDWTDIVLPQVITEIDGKEIVPEGVSSNLGDASIAGIEMSLQTDPWDFLSAGVGLSYNKAEFDNGNVESFMAFPSFAPDGDMSGQTLSRQPELQGNVNATGRWQFGGEWNGYVRGDAMYQSRWYVGLPNQAQVPSHWLVNLRLGVDYSDRYTIEIWSNNLLDNDEVDSAFRDVYLSNALPDGTNNFDTLFPWRMTVSQTQRRTYGITLRARF